MIYSISSRWSGVYLGPERAHLRIFVFKIQASCLSAAARSRFWLQLVPHQIFFNLFSVFTLTRPPWRPLQFSINYSKIVLRCAKINNSRDFCILLQYGCCIYFYVGTSWDTMALREGSHALGGWLLRHFVLESVSSSYCRSKLDPVQLFNWLLAILTFDINYDWQH